VAAVEIGPDVLLTDYVLPDVDGLIIAQRLKADPRTAGICILMVTGYATPDLERRALEAGIDRVLLKPCLPQMVMREVTRALARAHRKDKRPAPLVSALPSKSLESAGPVAATRVRDEFAALPGLSLTAEQVRVVFNLDREMCDRILHALVAEGFLSRTPHGTYTRPTS
jgi:DNA-binding response OmpR family regulator